MDNVSEAVDPDGLHKPSGGPESWGGDGLPVLELPIVKDAPLAPLDRRDRFALNASGMDEPAQPASGDENRRHQGPEGQPYR